MTYFSPFWRSPTPFGRFISCRAQSTVPTPVAARPREDFVSAILTALWLTQVLRCMMNQYIIFVFCQCSSSPPAARSPDHLSMTYIPFHQQISPASVQARIYSVTRDSFPFEAEVCVYRDEKCITPPGVNSQPFTYISLHYLRCSLQVRFSTLPAFR